MLGKLLGGVVRLVNVPVRITEAATDVILGEPGATKDAIGASDPLDRVAEILEESLDDERPTKEG